jgi:hypothetical protein
MNIMATSEANIVSLLNNIKSIHGIIYEVRQGEIALDKYYKDKPHTFIDKLNDIDEVFKKVESLVMHSMLEAKSFKQYCDSNMNALLALRQTMLNEIDKRRNTEVQMNILGEVYDEENLMMNFSVDINGDEYIGDIFKVKMNQLTDPKDYSIVNVINRFESEETLLDDIKNATQSECKFILDRLEYVKHKVTEIRSKCNDTEFVDRLCEDGEDAKSEISAFINNIFDCSACLDAVEQHITYLFQVYQELVHNYKVYAKTVDIYISFALECFFNDYSKYEF